TVWPSASNRLSMYRPTNPVAPVRKTFIQMILDAVRDCCRALPAMSRKEGSNEEMKEDTGKWAVESQTSLGFEIRMSFPSPKTAPVPSVPFLPPVFELLGGRAAGSRFQGKCDKKSVPSFYVASDRTRRL